MTTDQYERDFETPTLKQRFPGRFDPRLLSNADDAGDGFPGLQKLIRNWVERYLHESQLEQDLDFNNKKGINLAAPADDNDAARKIYVDNLIGGGGHTHDEDTLQLDGVNSNGGAFSFSTSGAITFNQNLLFSGSQTIDGVDVSALKSDVDEFNDELKDLIQTEIQQLENIGSTTISSGQWGYLGVMNQNIRTTDSPTFGGLALNGQIDMNNSKIVDLALCTNPNDGATKDYVDNVVGAGGHTHDGDTLSLDGVNSNGGTFSFTTTGQVTFNQKVKGNGLDANSQKLTNVANGTISDDAMAFGQKYTDSNVESIITAELVNGQSIDAAIDSLILSHKNITTAHHSAYTDTDTEGVITAELVNGQSIDLAIDSLISTHTTDDNAHHEVIETSDVESIITAELVEGQSIDNRIDALLTGNADGYQTQTDVEGIIDTEVGAGQSIDNAIDALITTHHDSASTDHDDRYYTETETDLFKLNKWVAPDGDISMNTHKITGVVDPTSAQDASTKIYVDDVILEGVASDDLVHSNDDEKSKNTGTYAKIKEIRGYINGKIRVFWEAKTTADADYGMTRVYINDVAVGSEHSNATENYQAFTEDITVRVGDYIQIWGWAGVELPANRSCYVQYQRIKFIQFVNSGAF